MAGKPTLPPDEVERQDQRRRRGQTCLLLSVMFLLVAVLVTIWAGQDWTVSPGFAHPMVYWDALLFIAAIVFGVVGLRLRRGTDEFFSY